MNIQQFKYILALARERHFETAANQCYISQSTLSTMISKFEDEIGIKIFDRKKKPVTVTKEGTTIINQIKVILDDINQLEQLTHEIKGVIKGNLRLSVIPTIAPFLLPLFIQQFANEHSDLTIEVREQTTDEIIRLLKTREIDIAIVSTPLYDADIIETHLYDEPFVYYDATDNKKETIQISDVSLSNLCLLEEGHCLRTQVLNLCELQKSQSGLKMSFDYRAGSIDSLLRFVKANSASTLLPFLATTDMSALERSHIRHFGEPVPYRSIGVITHRHFVKSQVLQLLKHHILKAVQSKLPAKSQETIIFSPK